MNSKFIPMYSKLRYILAHRKYYFQKSKYVSVLSSRKYSTEIETPKVTVEFSNGNKLTLSAGKYARFSDGAALGAAGDTSVLVTAVSKEKSSPPNFLPLVVDYRQKAAAAGRIPTNFLRRETGPNEHEILTSRLIDRSLRPLFPAGFTNETQIICNLLAVDGVHDPDVLSINAASAALTLSDIPWNGPVGAVRVGMLGDELIVNPTRRELSRSSLNLIVVAANQNLVVMLEGGANDILQQDFNKAIKFGVKECQAVVQGLIQLKKFAKPKREFTPPSVPDENIVNFIKLLAESKLREILSDPSHDKISRDKAVRAVRTEVMEKIKEGAPTTSESESYCSNIFDKIFKNTFRSLIFESDKRCDGRALTDLRPISCEVDLYQPLHGSALFQRGQTQVLCTVALDSPHSAVKLDPVTVLTSGLKEKNFFLHYEFPPYATNEIGRSGPAMRREIGHGALAERALRPLVPANPPFTVRLTSEVLESNGSSSMATVCGGSLALMDAGVPLSAAGAGVAIGLITQYENDDTKHMKDYRILTDILGIEDYLGDMDFKLAGTKKGITAIQADIKIPGLPLKVVMEAVLAGCEAKSKIIDIMDRALPSHRVEKKSNWPVNDKLDVPAHKRAKFMGPGGVNLKKLMVDTGVEVTYHEDGTFTVFAPNQDAMDEAKEQIDKNLTESKEPVLDFGGIYKAKIVEMREIGVMVTLYDSMVPALLHNSQLDQRKINHPSVLGIKVGDEIQVKYFGRDPVSGVMRLSRKVLQGPASSVIRSLNKNS
ncbi:polyribonucleotide nucleotidyltransferase 1, mitochondrial [Planococcus citri]|uniref:polyribonucleotide nucleotidyltransferase 1, mitochondrial n=1 Tax=Planococcus citri TaxID=170843 RepID=UPI0031F78824